MLRKLCTKFAYDNTFELCDIAINWLKYQKNYFIIHLH